MNDDGEAKEEHVLGAACESRVLAAGQVQCPVWEKEEGISTRFPVIRESYFTP